MGSWWPKALLSGIPPSKRREVLSSQLPQAGAASERGPCWAGALRQDA